MRPHPLVAPLIVAALGLFASVAVNSPTAAAETPSVAILVYHRFAPTVQDAMTVRTATFRWQLEYLRHHHHPVIPLVALVSYLRGLGPPPPDGAVVITADDGHESIVREMLPAVREYRVPVTLFIYPSAISNARYAMSWNDLDNLQHTGLFDVQSHTFWHPNFTIEKRRLSPVAYRAFAATQLTQARAVLRSRLGVDADLLAWPFGIEDDDLAALAVDAGYVAGFTIERRRVTSRERLMALPRFLVTDGDTGSRFAALLSGPR